MDVENKYFLFSDCRHAKRRCHPLDHNGISGTWSCKGDDVIFVWANGRYLDHVTLLPDPNRLEGTNINGDKFTGTRE
jgi:hypothetical protein